LWIAEDQGLVLFFRAAAGHTCVAVEERRLPANAANVSARLRGEHDTHRSRCQRRASTFCITSMSAAVRCAKMVASIE
jgi:hypothetical protein